MTYNEQTALKVFDNLVDEVSQDTDFLHYCRSRQADYGQEFIEQLNVFRELTHEIAHNLKDEEFQRMFARSSEGIRGVIQCLEAVKIKTEAAEANCESWLRNYRR